MILHKYANGLLGWPDEWTDLHYNGINDPCDMLIGPCACGAWHNEQEEWVVELLAKHDTEIREAPETITSDCGTEPLSLSYF